MHIKKLIYKAILDNFICTDLFLNRKREIKQMIATKKGKIDVNEKNIVEILPK